MRSCEVAGLELDDIDWRGGELRVRGKGRGEDPLPLLNEVGEALACYLHDGRLQAETRKVFLTSLAPVRGLKPASVGQVVRRACERTGRAPVGPHRLRHALGTRMINQGVPAHIVQRYLGHASPQMTAVYAHLHDKTMRAAFDQYCKSRVNIVGQLLPHDADSPATDAEWIKHNLARVADSLPNGYCGRPPQRDCPHPNACLTCPDFQTTPEFLPVHRAQAKTNRRLIAKAEADGRFRQVANLRKVQDSLDSIIPALEALHGDDTDNAS